MADIFLTLTLHDLESATGDVKLVVGKKYGKKLRNISKSRITTQHVAQVIR